MNSEAQKAFDYIKSNLAGSVWRQDDVLPGIRRLALMAGVSRASVPRDGDTRRHPGALGVERQAL